MADQRVVIEGPSYTGGYVYSAAQQAGVVAANNFLSLSNPTGSGKLIVVAGVFVSSIIVGDIDVTVQPLRGWLATNVAGGTLQAASTIGKTRSTMPAPAGEIRLTPTATLGAAWFNSPALVGAAKTSAPFVHQIPAAVAAGPITLLPGEGTVLRTDAGDVDTRWNLSIAWSEIYA